jgi:nitroreductase
MGNHCSPTVDFPRGLHEANRHPHTKERPMNEILNAIQNRRNIRRFKSDPIDDEKIQMILEAGKWAPSFSNLQPWKFIVIKDLNLKEGIEKAAKEIVLHWGIKEAPIVILVCADEKIDQLHSVEAGAVAAQNMALAAHSLGLGTGWIGIRGTKAEAAVQKLLGLAQTCRVVSLLPIGKPDESPKGSRKPLKEFTQFK